jgi:signal transduction histidine kinase
MRFLFALFLCSLGLALRAQNPKLDSLLAKLRPGTADTTQVNLHNQLAGLYATSDPAATRQHAEAALNMAQKLAFGPGETQAFYHLGDYHWRQGQYALAVERTTQALKLATTQGDSLAMADAYRQLGIIRSFGLHQYQVALRHQHAARGIYERHQAQDRTLGLYGNMSWVYCMMGEELPLAHAYAQKALALAQKTASDRYMGWAYNSLGLVCLRQGQFDSARHYLDLSTHHATLAVDRGSALYNRNLLGEMYLVQKKYPEARKTLLANLVDIRRAGFNLLVVDAHRDLAQTYQALGRPDSALWHYQQHIRTRDSLQNIETSEKIAIIEAGYAEGQRQAQIDYLKKERLIVSGIVATGFAALLAVLFVTARSSRLRQRSNALLQAKNAEIAQQNEELAANQDQITEQRNQLAQQNQTLQTLNHTKDKLFAIIGHDLRAPINSLKGLLAMLVNRELSVEDFFAFSKRLQDGAEQVYFTLTNLLQWANSQMMGLKPLPKLLNINQISQEATHLFDQVLAEKNLHIDNQIPADLVAYADPDQVSLVFRNLVSNAIKFSSAGGRVTLRGEKRGYDCQLAVSDTGVGMAPETAAQLFGETAAHFTTYGTKGEKGTGLGLALCQEMIEANGGRIWVTSELGRGTTFFFTLPLG